MLLRTVLASSRALARLEDFRDEEVQERLVSELARIDVASVGVQEFSRELVAGAPKHLDQVAQVISQTVALYRQELPTEGAKQLHAALTGFDMLIQLVAAISELWHEELQDIGGSDAMTPQALEALGGVLESVISCQENAEHLELARVLDEELLPRMQPWSVLLQELSRKIGADALDDSPKD